MANIYKNTVILDSNKYNFGNKKIVINYEDNITNNQKIMQKKYSEMDVDQSKYTDMVNICSAKIPEGVVDIGSLIGNEELFIIYTDLQNKEQRISVLYGSLTQDEKDKFDSSKIYAESLMV